MRRVAERVVAKYPVRALAAVHRVGDLSVGDLRGVVAVSCPHRGEAFEAARMLIDDLKHEVPIWKHQTFADGTEEWVGACWPRAGERGLRVARRRRPAACDARRRSARGSLAPVRPRNTPSICVTPSRARALKPPTTRTSG